MVKKYPKKYTGIIIKVIFMENKILRYYILWIKLK